MRAAGRKDWFMDINRRGFLFLAAGGLLLLNGCGRKSARPSLPRGSRVLALGDSLTAGFGASAGGDYPRRLADITGWQVINGGVSGDTSAQALARLPGLLQPKPGLALVCIGGNDFLRHIGEDETRANISRILQTLQTASVPAVLVAEPHFTIGALVGSLSDHPLYGDLAETYRVPLLDGAWSEILGRRELRSDQIHANDEGYRLFAEKAADFLRRQGFFRP